MRLAVLKKRNAAESELLGGQWFRCSSGPGNPNHLYAAFESIIDHMPFSDGDITESVAYISGYGQTGRSDRYSLVRCSILQELKALRDQQYVDLALAGFTDELNRGS